MEFKDIKQLDCKNGKAIPLNPFNEWGAADYRKESLIAFENFVNNNQFSCSEELNGVVDTEAVEVIWQYRYYQGSMTFKSITKKSQSNYKDYNDFVKFCNESGQIKETRQFLKLKELDCEHDSLESITDVKGDNYEICHHCGKCDKLTTENKQEFGDRTVHELKTWQPYFDNVMEGKKKFEVRKNDRNYQVGDLVILKEYNPFDDTFTGRSIKKEIIYILNGGEFGIEPGYCVIQML